MSNHATTPRTGRQSKEAREQLRAIVERLGRDATPAQIREEAYRVGFGIVNGGMLSKVRSELWPDRPKKTSGAPKGGLPRTQIIGTSFACPQCSSHQVQFHGLRRAKRGVVRYLHCDDCSAYHPVEGTDDVKMTNRRRMQTATATEKECSRCRRVLPISAFGLKAADSILRRSECNECTNLRRAELQRRRTLSAFGLTAETHDKMVAEQNNLCAICNNPETVVKRHWRRGDVDARQTQPLSIDHCHKTGKVRGLLCSRCNLAIGNFGDDIALMEAALAYLRRHAQI